MGQHLRHVPPQEEGRRGLTRRPSFRDAAEAGGSVGTGTRVEAPFAAAEAFDAATLEEGRLLFAARWDFVTACHAMNQLPPIGPTEVSFAGRSNVGKSSLINALVDQKGLAHASNTPGRTRALNMFAHEEGLGPVIVDMPGYGYARASKDDVAAWTRLVFDFLRGRSSLRRVYLLIDARHGPKPVDLDAMKVLDDAAVSYQAVLTKADKINAAEQAEVVARTEAALRRRPAAHPVVLLTSADTGAGMPELRAAIVELLRD